MSNKLSKFTTGFNNWKHAHEALKSHENSNQRLDAMGAMCSRKSVTQIDHGLVKQYENEVQYWKHVLCRIVSVVKFLRIRNLAFCGKNELIGSPSNGNYLGILELLAEYDTFLA